VALLRTMIHDRHLPLWLHRICNGVFGAALLIGIGSIWFWRATGELAACSLRWFDLGRHSSWRHPGSSGEAAFHCGRSGRRGRLQ